MLDEGEGASHEVQQWALLHEDALGPHWHSWRRLPCGPRFQDGDVVVLDSVQFNVGLEIESNSRKRL